MAEQSSSFIGSTRGKVVIGSGIAAALVFTVATTFNVPKEGEKVAGSIVPAQRAQVSQISA